MVINGMPVHTKLALRLTYPMWRPLTHPVSACVVAMLVPWLLMLVGVARIPNPACSTEPCVQR